MTTKYYQLSTFTEEQWDELNLELISQGKFSEPVPERSVELADDHLHSPTRGTYLLTDEEAEILKSDPRIKFINIDYKRYPEYIPPKDDLQATRPELIARYSSTIKNYREFETSDTLAPSPDATDANRTGYQLYRCQQKLDPWVDGALADNAVPEVNIFQYGTGRHVDVIVADEGMWLGHPEFQNNTVLIADGVTPLEKPNGYTGGNLLPGNGTCDVLDVVLDGPYYIDPEWFDASPETRLTTRWDGTIVPVESVARTWWSNASQRSAKFASAGTVSISSLYTRTNTSGDNTVRPSGGDGEHGTPCGALTYGRTQGWAYNANKWTLDLYGSYGSGIEQGFDIQKIFHQLKPINPLYGTKDPTISSNSWGYRSVKDPGGSTWYYTHRASSNVAYTTEVGLPWLEQMGFPGDGGRFKGEMKTNSLTTALDELIDAGVIFVVASGNSTQKQVNYGHPDFDNYITTNNGGSLLDSNFTEFGINVYGTTNRRGFPQQGGKYVEPNGSVNYKTINIGALDDDLKPGSADGTEDIAFYTSLGTSFNNSVWRSVILPDESILIGGDFQTLDSVTRNRLVKLNEDLTVDTAFYTNLGTAFNSPVTVVVLQSDGKILVGGDFTTFNGNARNRLVRLNATGTEDTAFSTNVGTGFSGGTNFVRSTVLQSDGKIIVGGDFTTFNGNTRNRLVRLNADGTEDTAFYTNLGTGFNNEVWNVTLQSDGKILASGAFTSLNGTTRNGLVRLNSDGTVDTAFYTNLGTGFGSTVRPTVQQSDGKIIVGGDFTSFNSNTRNRLVRLNSDGTEDTAFYTNLGTGFSGTVWTLALESDGKIIAPGGFSTFNDNTRNSLVRLNADGTEDTAFYTNLGTGFGSIVWSATVQPNGGLLLGGLFTTFNENTRNRFVRLNLNDPDIEAKVSYSDRGNGIDLYAPADGTLAANKSYTNEGPRPDTYADFTYNSGTAYDCAFSGTSAACPVSAGFLATVIEYNRDWTWSELKSWIETFDAQDPSDFYYGTESTTPTTVNWNDTNSLEGGVARVAYQAPFDARFRPGPRKLASGLSLKGIRFRK
jgi:uncharacterized delta-60 repeat protein